MKCRADDTQNEFYDVFLIDSDFAIERPKRAYRTGLHLLSGKGKLTHKSDDAASAGGGDNDIDIDNPMNQEMLIQSGEGKGQNANEMHDEVEHDASQHTFFIVNSQIKLKLVAKNAVSSVELIVMRDPDRS